MAVRDRIPKKIFTKLWGDRDKFGLKPDLNDPDWKKWERERYTDFYQTTQQKGLGYLICNLAYPVLKKMNFKNKKVLEIGPGIIRHLKYFKTKPIQYSIYDNEERCLYLSQDVLEKNGINSNILFPVNNDLLKIPMESQSVDVIISFNSLEHLHPLGDYLLELDRVLKVGGKVIGGIPCEGGLAWGIGRYFTTRRYVYKYYGVNYDKIICWEHPNFADFIIKSMNTFFSPVYSKFHPFPFLPIDLNLVASFIYEKKVLYNDPE